MICEKIKYKESVLRVLFYVFRKAMVFLSCRDDKIRCVMGEIPDGFVFSIKVQYANIKLSMIKMSDGFIDAQDSKADLELIFVNPCSALLVFSGILSQHEAFAQHRIFIRGDISDALVLTSAIERLQEVIFPSFVVKRLKKDAFGKEFMDVLEMLRFYSSLALIKTRG